MLLLDTRGALDSDNRHNARSIIESVNQRYASGINYVFICVRVGRINLPSKQCIDNIVRVCNAINSSRIKIIFTYCDGWNQQSIDTARGEWMDHLDRIGDTLLKNLQTVYVGSLPDGIMEDYMGVKSKMENATRDVIGDICMSPNSNTRQKLINKQESCLLS